MASSDLHPTDPRRWPHVASSRTRARDLEALVTVLHTLTSFETFDSLAGPDRTPTEVVPVVVTLVDAALEHRFVGECSGNR